MVKILHIADFHLDSSMDALPPAKATERRAEFRATISKAIQYANEADVKLILIPGDVFDGGSVFYETAESLSREFAKARARIFIAPGNHDFYAPGSIYSSIHWSDNVHIFKSQKIERVDIPEIGASVYGAAFTSPGCDHGLLKDFKAEQGENVSIMVMHGDVGQPASRYNPISLEEIAESGLDYLALGHVHAFGGILKQGDTTYAYPGCIEGRGFDELGDKGAITGIIGKRGSDLSFLPLSNRRYQSFEVDITGLNRGQIIDSITGLAGIGGERDIVRVFLKGEQDIESIISAASVENDIRDGFYHIIVHDNTRMKQNIWQNSGADTLRGQFLRMMKEGLDKAKNDAQREEIRLAVRIGIAALEKRELF